MSIGVLYCSRPVGNGKSSFLPSETNTHKVRVKYVSKSVQINRHGKKSGNHLSQEGIESFGKTGAISDPERITDLFCGTGYGRTAESALAAMVYGGVRHVSLHTAIDDLGSPEMDEPFDGGFMKKYEEVGDALVATKEYFSGEVYQQMLETLESGLRQAFDAMPDDIHRDGLMFGHTPFIEMLAEAHGAEDVKGLNYGEGYVFAQADDGSITAVKA